MPINQWRGPCRYCGNVVGKRKGLGGRSGVTGRWLVWHGRCEPKAAPVEPSPPPITRKPYNDD